MRVGIPRESQPGETRVAATPKSVAGLRKLGFDVLVEADAGSESSFTDDAYTDAGAVVTTAEVVWQSDVILKVNAPDADEWPLVPQRSTVIALMNPAQNVDLLPALAEREIDVLAMDAVPRISRAQSLDVLSSMANIAGYRAVIEAANEFGSFFTGQVTAAGKVPPAKVLVVGAGVAGLAAIGTARSLGAIVRATDTRPEVAEQVASMGAEFLPVEAAPAGSAPSDGYAKQTSKEYEVKAAELYAAQCREVDIVVTTALIPGRPAPLIITEEMVASMKPGSVIVDMAAAAGGNVAGTVSGDVIDTPNEVTIIGYTDLAGRLPTQASQMYATNVLNLMKLLCPAGDGVVRLDIDDIVLRQMAVTHDGAVMWPPPSISVSAANAATPPPEADRAEPPTEPAETAEARGSQWTKVAADAQSGATAKSTATDVDPVAHEDEPPDEAPAARVPATKSAADLTVQRQNRLKLGAMLVGSALFLLLASVAPAAFLAHIIVFALACVVGFYVVWNVTPALHTPLMSVTNAISGIIVIGALIQLNAGRDIVVVLACIGVLVASINVFGGFAVTRRMLTMFRKD